MENQIKKRIETFFIQFPEHQFAKGNIILHPEQHVTGASYLKSGYVRSYGISPQGIEITIHIFSPGAYFPMINILNDLPNRYYYEAMTDVTIQTAPKEQMRTFLKEEPEVLFELTSRILAGLDKMTLRIEHLAFAKAYNRLVSVLLYLVRHFGEEKDGKVELKEKFTHRDIASLAGMTRETASREWEKLQKKGLISHENQVIVVNDLQRLRDEMKDSNDN